jgi:hypothetical protein
MALSPDLQSVVTGCHDGTVRLWDSTTGKMRYDFRDQTRVEQPVVAFSPDGTLLASGGYDGTIQLWRADARSLEPPDF